MPENHYCEMKKYNDDDDDDDDDNDVGRTLGECRAVAHHGLVGADADAVAAQMCSLLRSLEDDT